MILKWRLEEDELRADHPIYHDEGVPLYYVVQPVNDLGDWEASFEGSPVPGCKRGPLAEVLAYVQTESEMDVFTAIQEETEKDAEQGTAGIMPL